MCPSLHQSELLPFQGQQGVVPGPPKAGGGLISPDQSAGQKWGRGVCVCVGGSFPPARLRVSSILPGTIIRLMVRDSVRNRW